MNKQKLLFVLALIGILTISLITQSSYQLKINDKIKSISYGKNIITINLQNNSIKAIIFTNKIINLKKEDNIIIFGKFETYQNQTQIIADRIIKIN